MQIMPNKPNNKTHKKMTPSISHEQEEDQACNYALELVHSSMLQMVMNAALRLDVFEIIDQNGDVSPSFIASRLPTESPTTPYMLEKMLHLLASYSILTCTSTTLDDGTVEKRYGLSPAGKYFVKDRNGGSFANLFMFQCEKPIMEIMYHWKDSVLSGESAWNEAYKTPIGKYMATNPSLGKKFNTAMTDMVGVMMNKVLNTYKGFENLKSLVDIGGGNGTTLNMITLKYPSIKGINFDMPHVIKYAPAYPSIEHVGGDMFESIPKGDALMLKHVIHNWSDELCVKVLSNCYRTLPDDGKVIIIESVLPDVPETDAGAKYISLVDNLMMSIIEGKERTKDEFVKLSNAAGFSQVKFVCCVNTYSVIEVYK